MLFLDEPGQLSQRRVFALGDITLRDLRVAQLARRLAGNPHAQGLAGRPGGEVARNPTGEVPPPLADAVIQTLARAPIRCYMTVLDIHIGETTAPEFFTSAEDIYPTGLMFLGERFQLLVEASDDVGMIVIDSRFPDEDARLRRFFADLTKDGSPYSRLDRIVESLFLGPSHYSIGLPCADLVCSITTAAERGNSQARGHLKTLMPRFASHPAAGSLDGLGIMRFPEQVRRPREETRLF